MENEIAAVILSSIGLVCVALAVVERGYKRFQDEKQERPDLKFNGAYLLNMIISGGVFGIILGALPMIISQITEIGPVITIGSVINAVALGYFGTYRVLDGLNRSTDSKLEVKEKTT